MNNLYSHHYSVEGSTCC